MENSNELFERAWNIIDTNYNVSDEQEAWQIVEALKLLVKANKMEQSPSLLKPKILMCMASCNFKIGNWTNAYNCALIANEEIKSALKISPFDEQSTRKMLSEDNNNEIIEVVKRDYPRSVTELMEDYVLNAVDTMYLKKLFPLGNDAPFTKEKVKSLIDVINHIKAKYFERAKIDGNYTMAQKSSQHMDTLKMPLYFVWEKYRFGVSDDVWEDGESMMPYHLFIGQLETNLVNLIDELRTESPFTGIETNRAITDGLIMVYTDLLSKKRSGKF